MSQLLLIGALQCLLIVFVGELKDFAIKESLRNILVQKQDHVNAKSHKTF